MAMHHKISTQTLPIRLYLDTTVVPLLMQGLLALGKERFVGASAAADSRLHGLRLSGLTRRISPRLLCA